MHVTRNADCLEVLPTLEAESVDLTILDPPYFKVVNEAWDYEWRTPDDYKSWVSSWSHEVAKVTRLGGSVYLFGFLHTLLHTLPIFTELGFLVCQQITISKGLRSIAGRHTKKYKVFPVTTESVVLLVKDGRPFVRELLREAQRAKGLTTKAINEALGVKTNGGGMWSFYAGDNIDAQTPTREMWARLSEVLDLKVPYEKFAVTFNLTKGLTDVWTDIDFYKEERIHPTQKPVTLMRRLIEASSNRGDKVLDPFLGGGSTLIACDETGRVCLGVEKDSSVYEKSLVRFERHRERRRDWESQRAGFEYAFQLDGD